MTTHFLDKYILKPEHPCDNNVDSVFEHENQQTLEDMIFSRYIDSLKAMPQTYEIKAEIRKYEKAKQKQIQIEKIPQDRMLLGFKDSEYTKPFAPQINALISKDGALTHNGMVISIISTMGAGKTNLAKKLGQDGFQARYKVKVPTIILDTNPTQEWHTGSEPITKMPQLQKRRQQIEDHFMKWNSKKARGYTNIIYGFAFSKGNDTIDRKFTLTLKDIFTGMNYDDTLYISMFADLIGLDDSNITSRLELSRALRLAKAAKLDNFTELKRQMRKKADDAEDKIQKKLGTGEESEAIKGKIVIPYMDNALDEGIISDDKTASLGHLFDDVDEYDNIILRVKAQSAGKSSIYQKRIGAYCIFFLDKIIQERILGGDSDKRIRAKSRLSIDKYPCGPIIILEEAKFIIPSTQNSYTGEYLENQVNLGRKTGMVIIVITQFADMVNEKILSSAQYTFVSKVNTTGTRKFLEEKGIDKDRIELELGTLKLKEVKGKFGLGLSEWMLITMNNEFKGPFIPDLTYSMFKIAGT